VTATSWRSLKSAASTIDTNAARPERAARWFDAPEPRTLTVRPRPCDHHNTPAVGSSVNVATVPTLSHRRLRSPRSGTTSARHQYPAHQHTRFGGVHGVQIAARKIPVGRQTDFLAGTVMTQVDPLTIGWL
jgi:hypothetical protein